MHVGIECGQLLQIVQALADGALHLEGLSGRQEVASAEAALGQAGITHLDCLLQAGEGVDDAVVFPFIVLNQAS